MDLASIALLRDDLFDADYTGATLDELWGPDAAAALQRTQRIPARRALAHVRNSDIDAAAEARATLAQLWVLGLPVARGALARALPRLGVDGAVRLGLAEEDGLAEDGGLAEDDRPSIRPLVELRPHDFIDTLGPGTWWVSSDLGELALRAAIGERHVLGVGGASRTLARLMMPGPAGSVLDLGTGCGILALHAARHSRRVVATDISARALDFARFNAALNGITSIEFRLGNLFEPVAGERFDRIVSNPPFVITPRVAGVPAYEYRDGGMVGDELVAAVIAGVSDHLEPGGVAQLLGNWEYRGGDDGLDRLRGWVDASAQTLDAWAVEREVQNAALYAETWIRDGGTLPRTDEFDRLYEAWLDDFEARAVNAVGFGYLTLRLPADSDAPLRRLERLTGPLGNTPFGLGEHVANTLGAHDWQAARSDDELGAAALTVATDVTEERHYWPGDEHPTVMDLRQGGGFARTVPLGTALAAVVGACDGELSVSAICSAVAELLEVDGRELFSEILPSIRELIVTGFLVAP